MKIFAMLPTWNEAQNIAALLGELLALRGDLEALVVDDDSPDGTWRIVGRLAAENPRVHLIHRRGARGRGAAGIAGFRGCLERGADLIIEMDADFSHHPRFIPALLDAAREAELVIGSRLVPGGGECGRSPARRLITQLGNLYARAVLGLPVRDCTSGFRVFQRGVFEKIGLENLRSNGPEIVQEVLLAAARKGCRMVEVPIRFEERRAGSSTFNWRILLRGAIAVWRFRLRGG